MAVHTLARVSVGPLDENAIVEAWVTATANCPLWSPVVLAAAGSGEDYPRVATTTTAKDTLTFGVTCGPIIEANSLYCSAAAGDTVLVCTLGKVKCKVDGSTDAIAIGDALVTKAAAGVAILAVADYGGSYAQAEQTAGRDYIGASFAKALKAATADGDIIPVYVRPPIGTLT